MNSKIAVGLSLLSLIFLSAAYAETAGPVLTGAEFKKLVIGNTLQYNGTNRRTGGSLDLRFYFVDDKKLHMTSAGSSSPADETWSVTEDGKFCRISSRGGNEICGPQLRVKGDKLIGKSRRGNDFEYTLLKGRHVYTCARC